MKGLSTKSKAGLLVLMLFCGAVAVTINQSKEIEPLFLGKPVSFWVAQYKDGVICRYSRPNAKPPTAEDFEWDRQAREAFSRTESEAIPFLIKGFEESYPPYQERVNLIHQVLGPYLPQQLRKVLPTANTTGRYVRIAILSTFIRMGTIALPALPTIVKGLQDPDIAVRLTAMEAIQKLGPAARNKALLPLLNASRDTDIKIQEKAIGVMATIAPRDKQTIAAFHTLTNHPSPAIRIEAAQHLEAWNTAKNHKGNE